MSRLQRYVVQQPGVVVDVVDCGLLLFNNLVWLFDVVVDGLLFNNLVWWLMMLTVAVDVVDCGLFFCVQDEQLIKQYREDTRKMREQIQKLETT